MDRSKSVISSTITPKTKKAARKTAKVSRSTRANHSSEKANHPKPINCIVRPIWRDKQIQNALKNQTCCCCDLQIGLTIGFIIIIVICVSSLNIISIFQLICAIFGITGVWIGRRTHLKVAKVALYVNICLCLLQILLLFILYAMIQQGEFVRIPGIDMIPHRFFYLPVLIVMTLSKMISILLQIVMIGHIKKAIIVMNRVDKGIDAKLENMALHTV